MADALRRHLSAFRRPRRDPGAIPIWIYAQEEDQGKSPVPYSYLRGGSLIYRNESLSAVFQYVAGDILRYATENVRAFVALHAGAAARSGGAIVLPAPPDTGKSTIVAALLRQGFEYLSDEVAALDPITSAVYPFARPLYLGPAVTASLAPLIEERSGEEIIDRRVRPDDLGASVAGPTPVRWLVFMSGEREGRPTLHPMSWPEAVQGLTENSLNLHRYSERGLVFLSRVAAEAECFRLEGGSADERAALLSERFAPS